MNFLSSCCIFIVNCHKNSTLYTALYCICTAMHINNVAKTTKRHTWKQTTKKNCKMDIYIVCASCSSSSQFTKQMNKLRRKRLYSGPMFISQTLVMLWLWWRRRVHQFEWNFKTHMYLANILLPIFPHLLHIEGPQSICWSLWCLGTPKHQDVEL